jgi:hypothetical protein
MRGPLPAATKRGTPRGGLPRRAVTHAARTGALAALRTAWRDALLDDLARVLRRNRETADLGRRLARYLDHARELEAYAILRRTADALAWLDTWTRERRAEIHHKRPESTYRAANVLYLYLTDHFTGKHADLVHDDARAARTGGKPPRPADWRPIVRDAWTAERPGARLTDAQADAIAVTASGRIRRPKAMALEMLAQLRGDDDVAQLRRELHRRRLTPPVL